MKAEVVPIHFSNGHWGIICEFLPFWRWSRAEFKWRTVFPSDFFLYYFSNFWKGCDIIWFVLAKN